MQHHNKLSPGIMFLMSSRKNSRLIPLETQLLTLNPQLFSYFSFPLNFYVFVPFSLSNTSRYSSKGFSSLMASSSSLSSLFDRME